jgi:DUF4097 and DUF4098 domain-containing protein YvlB
MHAHWMSRAFLFTALLAVAAGCVFQTNSGVIFATGGERAERRESLPLELVDGERAVVELQFGDIVATTVDGEAAHVEAHWHANAADKETAEAVLARYRLEIVREQGSLHLRAVGEPLEVNKSGSTHRLAASVDLRLVLPSGVRLVARTSSGDVAANGGFDGCELTSSYGDISAAGIRGVTTLKTSSGDVLLEGIEAASVDAQSQYGDVHASNLRAGSVRLSTSSGEVRARQIDGALVLHSGYGDLSGEDLSGDLEATTSSGDISVGALRGSARRKLTTRYGDVSVSDATGELEAQTSSGDVLVSGADGSVSAKSSYGDVVVSGRFTELQAKTSSGSVAVKAGAGSAAQGDWNVSSSYGDVSLQLPADFSCTLKAMSATGDLQCDFAKQLRSADGKPARALDLQLGSGGKLVEVATASGDVSIRAGK